MSAISRTQVPGLVTVRSVGSLIPADLLSRIVDPKSGLPGLSADAYDLELGITPTEAANRAWSVLTAAWAGYTQARHRLPHDDRATSLTRDKWLAVVLRELGFGRVPATPAGGMEADGKQFPVSHIAGAVPVHLLGWGVDLDRKTPKVAGAAERAPHAMVQELLNRSDDHLWALLANGMTLRVLRDSSSLVGQSYVEFDLQAMFDGEVFSDFTVLYLLCHRTRFEPVDAGGPGSDCWLERWRTHAAETGARALGALRTGVKSAVEALGTGFLRHPANTDLRQRLDPGGDLDLADYHRALLRLVYRLLFVFVAEDRDLLLAPDATPAAKARYTEWFSTRRLRRTATRRRGTRHDDLWQALTLVLDGLGSEGGRPELGLPALGGLFENGPADTTVGAALANQHLLTAIRHLCIIQPHGGGPKRIVDYRNLGAEELGGIYESLLEFVPRHDPHTRTFTLEVLGGNDRKTSGAYYTPSSLIDCLLNSALDPLLDEAEHAADPEAALLALTVCDPACGSGHFLVAAARRIAHRLARARAEGAEPSLDDAQAAMHDVVSRCIYGVDLNPMAAELAKVSLWLEAIQPGRPLGFLDAHIKVGNALLGTTPALLAQGIPDEAYVVLEGDNKKAVSALKTQNRAERGGQGHLFANPGLPVDNSGLADAARRIDAVAGLSLADVHLARQRQRELEASPELQQRRLLADGWCAAFVTRKEWGEPALTQAVLNSWAQGPPPRPDDRHRCAVERLTAEYRFFHWHLEFPHIFPTATSSVRSAHLGWTGGFSCMIGNPPWDTMSPDTREFFGGFVPSIRAMAKSEKDRHIAELLTQPAYSDLWERHKRHLFAAAHFLKRSGRYVMYAEGNLGKGDFNTYRSFAEVALSMAVKGGSAGQVIQSGLYSGANSTAIRRALLEQCTWLAIFGFNNRGGTWFDGVTLENFALYAARVGVRAAESHEIEAAFGLPGPKTLAADLSQRRLTLAVADIRAQNPVTLSIPDIRDPRSARVSQRLYRQWPPFGTVFAGQVFRDFSREIDMSDKGDVFGDDPSGVPVYEGRMIDFYDHRAKRYISGHGNSSLWEEVPFGSPRKEIRPQWRVRLDDLTNDAVRARIRDYRIGFMDVADPGRQRSFVSALIPPGCVCGDKVPTLRFPDHEWYMPIYLAIANSMVLDFLARQRVMGKKLALNILDGLPIARLSKEDPRSAWLAIAALRLTCTSRDMIPFWNTMAAFGWVDPVPAEFVPGVTLDAERRQLRAEMDAYVARFVYGLERDELALILESFTQLEGIEVKRHGEYTTRRLVLSAYEALLAEESRASASIGGGG